jgi:hypothetical protein
VDIGVAVEVIGERRHPAFGRSQRRRSWDVLAIDDPVDRASPVTVAAVPLYRFHSALNRRPTVLRHRVSE